MLTMSLFILETQVKNSKVLVNIVVKATTRRHSYQQQPPHRAPNTTDDKNPAVYDYRLGITLTGEHINGVKYNYTMKRNDRY